MTHSLKTGAPLLFVASLIAWCVCVGSARAARPNIVVIVADDAGYSDFGFSANAAGVSTKADTPNLDALAQQSVVLSQGYVAAPLCGTSRAGLLTGQYQQRFGNEYNLPTSKTAVTDSGSWGLSDQQITVAQRLKGLGYSTGAIGKWHSGYQDGLNLPLDKGFDEFFGFWGGARQYYGDSGESNVMRRGDALYEAQWRTEGDPSKYDPVKGRYVTDAFGEEAVAFIDNHANDENPFFLYLAYNSPHSPYSVKQSDYDHFSNISDTTQRTIAALNYAMDRSIGEVIDSLNANGIDDNTIVVFLNDNGPPIGASPAAPYRGWKGSMYEAGIRVPFLIKAPGLLPGEYDGPVTAYDIVPTLFNAAGGDTATIPTDGYDVMPLLTGDQTEDPHEYMYWRSFETWAVRYGDWKLTAPHNTFAGHLLYNLALDPTESTNYSGANPQIVDQLMRKLTLWEATLAKPKWKNLNPNDQNQFDHFIFRNDLATAANWNAASSWTESGTANIATLIPADAYANAILEFTVRNDADYTATNNMKRMTNRTFMMNQFRFSGDFSGASAKSGTINGNAVVLVKSLDGALPKIRLDAMSTGTAATFTFNLGNELQLLHDLEITGNGTQQFVINGAIRDYYEPLQPSVTTPHNVRKLGTSSVTLAGNNTFAGSLTVEQGKVTVSGPTAAINGAQGIDIHSAGNLTLESGTIAVNWINNANGGLFQFNGGLLKVVNFQGNLTNSGGTFSPGASPAISSISGNFNQQAGTTVIEIAGIAVGSQYDSLVVGGSAQLGSILDVDFLNGYSPTAGRAFQVITAAGGVSGTFPQTLLPALSGGLFWNVLYGTNSVVLAVAPTNSLTTIPGDFNLDGTVDAGDYTVWRDHLGTNYAAADANFDGQVTTADYGFWKSHFGYSLVGGGFAAIALQSVPEPTAATLLIIGLGALGLIRPRFQRSPRRFVRR